MVDVGLGHAELVDDFTYECNVKGPVDGRGKVLAEASGQNDKATDTNIV